MKRAVTSLPFTGFGTGWIDIDNDGDLDLFSANGGVSTIPEQRNAAVGIASPSQLACSSSWMVRRV
jgi:hypothetical protein